MPITLNQSLQDRILRLMAEDDSFLAAVAGRVEPEFFLSSLSGELARICLNYHAQFHRAPGDHFADEALRVYSRRSEEDRTDCLTYLQKIRELPRPNKDYLLRRISDAIKLRAREDAAIRFAEFVSQGKIDEADKTIYDALKSGIPEAEDALDYLWDLGGLADRADRPSYLIGTGVRAMDRAFGGYCRGELVSILGGAKAGKTWGLMWIAREALRAGLFVLHISHEVGRDVMELRYDMMFSGRAKKAGQEIVLPGRQERSVVPGSRRIITRSVYDEAACRKARIAVSRFGGRLMIKKYPMGQCKPSEVERLLDYLENYCDFVPDVVINDYVDIMDLSQYSKELRHQINAGYVWSKGLADERRVLVATASQVNREGLDRRHVRRKHVGEDIRKLANVDAMLAIGRSEQDVKEGLAGLSVMAARGEEQDGYCTFVPCFAIGQFCLDSWLPSEVDEPDLSEIATSDDRSRPGREYNRPAPFDQEGD